MLHRAQIQTVTPVAADQLRANVASSMSRGLPSVGHGHVRPGTLHIYANGPSLLDEPIIHPAMALNGALQVFADRGERADYWTACDPQPLVAAFLDGMEEPDGGYLVASRCDDAVFDALRNRRVSLWHIADAGADALSADLVLFPDAPSVTVSALYLAHYMGFRSVVIHGWDGCYREGRSHATDQADGKEPMVANVGSVDFMTNLSWLVECEDAGLVIGQLHDMSIEIAGDGLMATALKPMLDDLKAIRA